jgi:hypothetical protein
MGDKGWQRDFAAKFGRSIPMAKREDGDAASWRGIDESSSVELRVPFIIGLRKGISLSPINQSPYGNQKK